MRQRFISGGVARRAGRELAMRPTLYAAEADELRALCRQVAEAALGRGVGRLAEVTRVNALADQFFEQAVSQCEIYEVSSVIGVTRAIRNLVYDTGGGPEDWFAFLLAILLGARKVTAVSGR